MGSRNNGIAISIVLYKPDFRKLIRALECLRRALEVSDSRECFRSSHLFIVDNSVPALDHGLLTGILKKHYFGNNDGGHSWSIHVVGRNVGYGAGHNLVIWHHTYPYHVILNPDVYVKDRAFSVCWEYSERNPETVLITPRVTFADGTPQYLLRKEPTLFDVFLRFAGIFIPSLRNLSRYRNYECQHLDMCRIHKNVFPVTGCCMWCRSDILRDVGGFDERFFLYYEDYDLSRRLAMRGDVTFLPDFEVVHDWNRAMTRNVRLMFYNMISALKYFHKWGWKIL
ncbi:glycosyltransferase family 2 protein [Thermodesulforhabdus norvegica]|uniref:Glycosyltransferase, GT2 family n=1 Tax=Thermodesulforhabdus norvegica TaxID=39841 RepID=A0A1I4QV05_9BACT|nr:glycosyltransferase [Thermodesulforhabdus norvegica]SFM43605.1 hypothetical protein SAMN05660836_00226 [Thermodesulforhabdus norvegica]